VVDPAKFPPSSSLISTQNLVRSTVSHTVFAHVRGPKKIIETETGNRIPVTSYYRSIVTMGLSRTVSKINGDFIVIRIFRRDADMHSAY